MSFLLLFTPDDLETAFQWIIDLRKASSPNSDIWRLRRNWKHVKDELLAQLNDLPPISLYKPIEFLVIY